MLRNHDDTKNCISLVLTISEKQYNLWLLKSNLGYWIRTELMITHFYLPKMLSYKPTITSGLGKQEYWDHVYTQNIQFSSIPQSCSTLCHPMGCARQSLLSITNCWSLLKLMSIESLMPSNHPILCRPFLLPPSIFPNIRVFSNESVLRIRWPKH